MKEIGGYMELESCSGSEYHEGGLALNSGRNCLAYLLRNKSIKKIYIPFFLGDSIAEVCKRERVEFAQYHINDKLRPDIFLKLQEGEWLYIVNYYGQITNDELLYYKKKYKNIIVDNVQAFFQKPVNGIDTIYTCRKFFGVADGAYLFSDDMDDSGLEVDCSYDKMLHLLGRFEKTGHEFYDVYITNEAKFKGSSVKKMSKLTHNFMKSVDYDEICRVRTQNFKYLHENLSRENKLKLIIPEGAFMYPLYVDNGEYIKNVLHQFKIYVPTLWPEVLKACNEEELEYDMAKNIIPIPVDQRYSIEEMKYIIEILEEITDKMG